jgi:hypothetical protein
VLHIALVSAEIPLSRIGLILDGDGAGRFVEIIDDSQNTGGYLIFTYADAERSPEVFDSWVETFEDVQRYFAESGWRVDWRRTSP